MDRNTKKRFPTLFYYLIILAVIFLFIMLFTYYNNKKSSSNYSFINFKLITNIHPDLPWEFEPINPLVEIKIGEVTNVEYIVRSLSNKKTSGIASFAYYPRELDLYISKIECFCYDIKTLKAREEEKYTLTMMIDPKVTKDIKTKLIKEAIIQFTFFDSNNFKENKN